MATTTNYSWTTPDDTALVKDGAAAIRSLGTAIDSTVFTNAGNAIAKTIVDAKGDIIAATAADTVARLAVGSNGQVLKANSATATGLEWGSASATFSNVAITPSLTQNNTVTTTNDFSGYIEIPDFVYVYFKLTATGTGTASNQIGVELTGAPTSADGGNYEIVSGVAAFKDDSANLKWKLTPYFTAGTTLRFSATNSTNTGRFGAVDFTAAIASNDIIEGFVVYRKA
jgi:hypothetical protein